MGVFLVNKTQNPLFLPYPFRGLLRAGAKVPVNLTELEAYTALTIEAGDRQNVIGIEAGAAAPFNDLVTGDAASGLLIGAIQSPIALSNTVVVQLPGDFPAPAAGVITLAAGTLYIVNGAVNIGSDRLVRSSGSQLAGFSGAFRDSLTSSTTGALVTNPGSEASQFSVTGLTLVAASGTIFAVGGAPTRFLIDSCILSGNFGTASGNRQRFENTVFQNFSAGIKFSAGGSTLLIEGCGFEQDSAGTGICIDLGANVWTDAVSLNGNVLEVAAAGTGFNGLATNGNVAAAFGGANNNILTGSGTSVTGITVDDIRWLFEGNLGNLLNSSFVGRYGFTTNLLTTPTTAVFTKIIGVTTSNLQKRFLHVADNRMDYIGIEAATVRIDVSLGASKTGGAGIGYSFAVFKNALLLGTAFPQIVDNKGATLSFTVVDPAAITGDDYAVSVRNLDNMDAITVTSMTVLLTRL